ncbi:MAG: PIN domain-containing protein [Desulfobacterales bacterium]
MIRDANAVLRYVLQDIPELFEKSVGLIENSTIFLPFEVIAEVVYVLEKVYNIGRKDVSGTMIDIIAYPNIETVDREVMRYALHLFSQSGLDFVDTLLCGYCYAQKTEIAKFDKKLAKQIKRINEESCQSQNPEFGQKFI